MSELDMVFVEFFKITGACVSILFCLLIVLMLIKLVLNVGYGCISKSRDFYAITCGYMCICKGNRKGWRRFRRQFVKRDELREFRKWRNS